ncbi:hypothetical protein DFP72DRAFT_1105815 [Ephemerocybe angulata]|uniref:Uncharacterized protein n=1 Tax=Ephemerocybe angulata TaxID=980116 RepID=A0A8H6HAY1_9AGAR|nr:hypothetical protein DFP72DRAFT_1105815 [Tulosesus angulatus]
MTTTMRDIEDGVKMMTRAQTTMTARTRWDDDEPYDYGERWKLRLEGQSFATGQTSIALENSRSPDEFLLRLRHLSPIRHVTTTGTLECPVGHANHPSLAGRISIVTSEGQRLRHSSHVTQVTANVKIPTLKTAQGSANCESPSSVDTSDIHPILRSVARRTHFCCGFVIPPASPRLSTQAIRHVAVKFLPVRCRHFATLHSQAPKHPQRAKPDLYRHTAPSGSARAFAGILSIVISRNRENSIHGKFWTSHRTRLIGFNGISPVCHSPEKFLAIALTSYLSPSHAPREPRPELGRNYAAAQVAARETQYSVSIDPHGHLALLAPTRSLVHYSMTLFDSLPRDLDRAHSAFKDGTRLISRRDLLSVRPLSKLSSHGLHDDTATTLA